MNTKDKMTFKKLQRMVEASTTERFIGESGVKEAIDEIFKDGFDRRFRSEIREIAELAKNTEDDIEIENIIDAMIDRGLDENYVDDIYWLVAVVREYQ